MNYRTPEDARVKTRSAIFSQLEAKIYETFSLIFFVIFQFIDEK